MMSLQEMVQTAANRKRRSQTTSAFERKAGANPFASTSAPRAAEQRSSGGTTIFQFMLNNRTGS